VTEQGELSALLIAWGDGDESALDEILPIVVEELRRIARAHMRRESPGHTLQTTALINEAYLKLSAQKNAVFKNRSHFFAIASKLMRRVLLDHAKAKLRTKRGGGAIHIGLEDFHALTDERSEEILALDEALGRLAELDPLKCSIVEMRHFGGMTVDETADALGVAPITVMRHWNFAKAWLKKEITDGGGVVD
jgi:RNA polymerase sigma-70 factor (ECF subfamily)